MKKSINLINLLVASFGVGVLMSIVFPAEQILFFTVLSLVILSIGSAMVIRG